MTVTCLRVGRTCSNRPQHKLKVPVAVVSLWDAGALRPRAGVRLPGQLVLVNLRP